MVRVVSIVVACMLDGERMRPAVGKLSHCGLEESRAGWSRRKYRTMKGQRLALGHSTAPPLLFFCEICVYARPMFGLWLKFRALSPATNDITSPTLE